MSPTPRQVLDAAMSERDWQRTVLELAQRLGWRCYHTFDSRRSSAGFPDLVLVRPPRLVVLELKTERGKLTPDQASWLRDLDACRVTATVARPSSFDALRTLLG